MIPFAPVLYPHGLTLLAKPNFSNELLQGCALCPRVEALTLDRVEAEPRIDNTGSLQITIQAASLYEFQNLWASVWNNHGRFGLSRRHGCNLASQKKPNAVPTGAKLISEPFSEIRFA